MLARSLVLALALPIGACSKSEPDLSSTAVAPASASPTTRGVATGGSNQALALATSGGDNHVSHMMSDIPSGLNTAGPVPGHPNSGNFGNGMPDRPMPDRPMPGRPMAKDP